MLYEETLKYFLTLIQSQNSRIQPKKNQRKFQKGPIIGQNEEIKIEKCLENKISKQHHNSFLIIHIYHKSSVPPNKTQHYQFTKNW